MAAPRRWTAVVAIGAALAIVGAVASSRYGRLHSSRLPHTSAADRDAFVALIAGLHCATVKTDAWSPLPGVEYTGRLGVTLPGFSGGEMAIVIGDEFPLVVDVETIVGLDIPVRKTRLLLGPGGIAPPPDYWLEEGSPLSAPPEVQRLTLLASAGSERQVSLSLGRRAPRVLARLFGYAAGARASVCAAAPDGAPAFRSPGAFAIQPQSSEYFGIGWLPVEDLPDIGRIRFMRQYGAMLIPSAGRGPVHVALEGRLGVILGAEEPALELTVNSVATLEARPMHNGTALYQWDIPERVWVDGVNELLFRAAGAPLGLQRLTLTRDTGSTVARGSGR